MKMPLILIPKEVAEVSKYTTEVRYICEVAAGLDESKGFSDVDEIIEAAIPSVFSFDFPIFDENYREVICTKILRHYYTREIGLETVGLWKLKMQTKLNEIMPFYNQLYESQLLKFNPLYDVDLNTTHVGNKDGETTKQESRSDNLTNTLTRAENGTVVNTGETVEGENKTGTNTSEGTSTDVNNGNITRTGNASESGNTNGTKANANNYQETENDTNYNLFSETPQGALTGVDEEEYLTDARKITDAKTKTGKNDTSDVSNENYSKTRNNSDTENNSTTGVSESNLSTSFDEKNDRTTINRDDSTSNKNTTENGSRTGTGSVTGNERFNNTEQYIVHVVGKQAGVSYSKLLKEFRDTFLNIDMDVINSLSDLFLNLW